MHGALPKVSGFLQDEIDYAREYFETHYNEEISTEKYAASRNMSISWFNKSFKAATGTSPMKYIQTIRIRNAQTLLETTDYSISDVASFVGYENPLYFSRLFRKTKGMSPSAYRKLCRDRFISEVEAEDEEGS